MWKIDMSKAIIRTYRPHELMGRIGNCAKIAFAELYRECGRFFIDFFEIAYKEKNQKNKYTFPYIKKSLTSEASGVYLGEKLYKNTDLARQPLKSLVDKRDKTADTIVRTSCMNEIMRPIKATGFFSIIKFLFLEKIIKNELMLNSSFFVEVNTLCRILSAIGVFKINFV